MMWRSESAEYLAVVRVAWGLLILYEFFKMWEGHLPWDYPATTAHNFGQLHYRFFTAPYHSVYHYAEAWLPGLQTPEWMRFFTSLWAVCGVAVVLGIYYHLAMAVFLALFTYHYLLAQEYYLNHQYLFIVITGLLTLLPAAQQWSVSALVHRWQTGETLSSGRVPRWMRMALVVLLDIVYLMGGFQKMNVDWLRAEPLLAWLPCAKTAPYICALLHGNWWYPYIMSYGGLAFDLSVPFLLHSRRWLPLGLLLSLAFHIHNYLQFSIGAFPWMCLALTSLYLPPDWPSRIWTAVPHWPCDQGKPGPKPEEKAEPEPKPEPEPEEESYTWWWYVIFALCLLIVLSQVAIPLRVSLLPSVYPTDPAWSDEGHMFSWRMKLRDRQVRGNFVLRDSCTNSAIVYHPLDCTRWNRQYDQQGKVIRDGIPLVSSRTWKKIRTRPDMLQRFSRSLGAFFERYLMQTAPGPREDCHVSVYGNFEASINRRPWTRLVDRSLDLADLGLSTWASDWLRPEPAMPGFYRYQYPWVFAPALLGLAEDNPCYPWHYNMADDTVRSYGDDACSIWWYLEGGQEAWFTGSPLLRLWETWAHGKFEDTVRAHSAVPVPELMPVMEEEADEECR